MYKTSDFVRYIPDGNLIYLGRNYRQVKIYGFRIELREIEARLMEHTLVKEVFVTTHDDGSDKRHIAYAVADPCEDLAHTLREYLMTKLPEYMVPSGYVQIDIFPLTSNGKLDRRALLEPESNALIRPQYEVPQNDIESTLTAIWADLLKVDRVGRNDNFFMLVGHSLLAVGLINEILSGLDFNLRTHTLFKVPTIPDLVPRIVAGED
ncbi:hypothetical protein BGZ46_010698 [Entomortierella lignicola]|nr:hypothetical protein BGZ46_010698 [Entomortierella lignicola]